MAEGRIGPIAAIEESEREPEDPAGSPSPAGLFARAFAARRTRAREGELKTAFDEIRAADAAIVGIARQMPAAVRRKIAEARTSLARSIIGLHRTARSWLPFEKEPDRDG